VHNRSNRNESRRPYSSQGSYSSRGDSRWSNERNPQRGNFSSFNEDEHARDFNMENSSSRRDWDYEGGTHQSYGRRNSDELRYGTDRYNLNDDRYSTNWQATSDYDTNSSMGRGGRRESRSRFPDDRESDSSPRYGNQGNRDYSTQFYSNRDYTGTQSYSGRGDHLHEDNYGSGNSLNREESRHGRFEGRGPKSYTRSDDRIKEDICDLLTRHSEIDAHEIEVEVKNGEVTLSGTVSERRMKHLAEDLAERVSSVKDVTNNIRVQKESTHDWSAQTDASKGTSASKRTGSNQNPNH
jgi:osmotically-inducible protein OsmY